MVSLLQTRYSTLKEWAYAGFFINLVAAAWSHLAAGQAITAPLILFFILFGSYVLWKQRKRAKSGVSKETATRFSVTPLMQ